MEILKQSFGLKYEHICLFLHFFNHRQRFFESGAKFAFNLTNKEGLMPPFELNANLNQNMNVGFVPLRLTRKDVCKLLGFSINQLRKISIADVNFPKPIKSGLSRQAGVYYDYNEIKEWHINLLNSR